MRNRTGGIASGLGLLLAILLVWQYAMPAYQTLTTIPITEAGLTEGSFTYLLFTYLPWWVLLCAIAKAVWMMIRPKKF